MTHILKEADTRAAAKRHRAPLLYKRYAMRWMIGILVAVCMAGCATSYIGMTRTDFLILSGLNGISVTTARVTATDTVYQDQTGLFYYFVNDRLVQIDRGIPNQTRYQYEIINR